MQKRFKFFINHLKNNKRNASITPSSNYLAKQMIKGIDRNTINSVIELGPGTGIFTEYIIKNAKPKTKIIVIEIEKSYISMLEKKFGDRIIIEESDVKKFDLIIKKHNIDKVDLIISGLPFVAIESIIDKIKIHTENGTIFRGFTYQPKTFEQKYNSLPIKKIGFTFLNMPPARVYSIN